MSPDRSLSPDRTADLRAGPAAPDPADATGAGTTALPAPSHLPDDSTGVRFAAAPDTADATGMGTTAPPAPSHFPDPPADAPTIPGYAVTAELARGGMGRVYAGHDLTLDREVAIKTLLPGASGERFVTESKIAARLPHPNIPPVHALGTLADGSPYLVMKLIRGRTLDALLKERASPADGLPRWVQVFEGVAQGVGFAHANGVIHRDLKPLNVMVGEFGEVQVMDWGLAKHLGERSRAGGPGPDAPPADAEFTQAGAVMGTPGYMAPEQARGEPVDARADVFALGAVLATILTDQPAFVDTTALETIGKAAKADLADVLARLARCGADAELVAVTNRCLSPSAADRPPDGRAVAAEVAAYRAGVEARLRRAETERAEALVREGEQRKRRRVVQWAGVAVAAVLLVGVFSTTVGLLEARRQEGLARAETTAKDKAREEEIRQRGIAEANEKLAKDRLGQVEAEKKNVEREKHKTEDEKRIAQAVKDFLKRKLLAQADGTAQANALLRIGGAAADAKPNPTVRELLGRAAKELTPDAIDANFPNQPLVQAEILRTVGDTYRGVGDATAAVELLTRSAELFRAHRGPAHEETLTTLNNLAVAYQEAGNRREAVGLFEQVRDARAAALGPDDPDALTSQNNLATAYHDAGRFRDAVGLYEKVHAAQAKALGPDHADAFKTLNNMAEAYRALGDLPRVIDLSEQVRAVKVRTLGGDHPSTLITLNNLAGAYQATGNLPRAIELFVRVREAQAAKLGADHPTTVITTNNLALAYQATGKLPQALELFELASAGVEKRRFQHQYAGRIVPNTIRAYEQAGALGKAEGWRRKWLAVVKEQAGADSPPYAGELAALGTNLLDQRKWADAEPVLRECAAVREKGDPDGWATFNTQSLLGGALFGQKKFADAEPLLVKGYEGMKAREKAIPPQAGTRVPEALDRLIDLYAATDKPDDAEQYRALPAKYPNAAPPPRPVVK